MRSNLGWLVKPGQGPWLVVLADPRGLCTPPDASERATHTAEPESSPDSASLGGYA